MKKMEAVVGVGTSSLSNWAGQRWKLKTQRVWKHPDFLIFLYTLHSDFKVPPVQAHMALS